MPDQNFNDYEVEDFATNESFINYWLHKNEQDREFWEQWLLQHPGKKTLADEAKQILQALSLTLSEDKYKKELERIKNAIISDEAFLTKTVAAPQQTGDDTIARRSKRRRAMRYFIPLLPIFLIGAWLVIRYEKKDENKLTQTSNEENKPMVFTLGDSTVVTLASHSSLRYSKAFTGENRDVYLSGAAAFNVTHNAAHPFKVYEDEVVATVLGTVFDVKKDDRDSTITVELLQGLVKVESLNEKNVALQSITLHPNEKVVYHKNDKLFHKELLSANTERASKIIFKNDDFNGVAEKFKDAFGIIVINKSNRRNWRFTGEFENITADELMENICLAENLSYEFQSDTIVIK